MNFLYACDDHYAPYAGVSITSLFENNKELDEITVFVLVNGVSQSNEQKFTELAEEYGRAITLIDAEEIDKHLADNDLLLFTAAGRETYFRLFADRVLPERINRVVYLDCDTIVLGNLQELDNIEFDDNTCCSMALILFFKHYKQYLGLGERDNHYQAGVCVFDIDRWKQLGAKRVCELFRQGITYMRMHDQDILNLAVNKNTITLSIKYNVYPDWRAADVDAIFKLNKIDESMYYSKEEIRDAIKNTKILHFCGEKPWTNGNKVPRSEQWVKYKLISPWRGIEEADFKLGFLWKCLMFLSRLLPKTLHHKILEAMHKYDVERYYKKHDHFQMLATYRAVVWESND